MKHLVLQLNKTRLKVFVPAIEWEYYSDQLCVKRVALRVVTCTEFDRAAPWNDKTFLNEAKISSCLLSLC